MAASSARDGGLSVQRWTAWALIPGMVRQVAGRLLDTSRRESSLGHYPRTRYHRPMSPPGGALVVGAGPAGLAAAACLRAQGVSFEVLEASERVGNAWFEHYERLHLHTVRDQSHLPFAPMPRSYPRYPSRDQVAAYLAWYAERFDVHPRFGQHATRIEADADAWVVTTRAGDTFRAPSVVVATGLNRVPHTPRWPGLDGCAIPSIHSRDYRTAEPFAGRRVLVVGMGNTGAEIALDLAEHGARPSLSVRGPVNIVRRDTLGRPVQLTSLLLDRLPHRLGDAVGSALQTLTVGDLSRFGIARPHVPPARQLRETGQTPVIDVGTLALVKRGAIAIFPGIERFESERAVFADGRSEAFDQIVLATGYEPAIDRLLPGVRDLLDTRGLPPLAGAGANDGLFFLGFNAYAAGGLLRSIRLDAPRIAASVASRHHGGDEGRGGDR